MTRLTPRQWLWLAAGLIVALILFMPLRIALDVAGVEARGLTARSVTGSVWSGTLVDARLGDVQLGTLRAGVSPLALLIGETRINLLGTSSAAATPVSGAVVNGLRGVGIAALTGDVPVGQVFAPLPITQLSFDDATARFRGSVCATASGTVRARLGGAIPGAEGIALPQVMTGTLRCAGDRLLVPLASAAGTETLTLRIAADGRYRADLMLQLDNPALADKLAAIGFVAGPGGYRLSAEGRF